MNTFIKLETKELEELFELKQGNHLPISELIDKGYPVFGANGQIGFYSDYMYEKPVVLITCRGATCGYINLTKPKSWVTGNAIALLPKIGIDTKFIYYNLKSLNFTEVISGSAQPQIIVSTLKHKKIKVPPLPTQRKIASILEKAESAREKRKEASRLTDEFLKSAFLEMFGDPLRNPKGWKICEVEDIAANEKHSIKAGPFGSSLKKEYYVKKGYKIYGQEQVIRDDLTFGDYYISEEKYKALESNKIKEGDILISLVGTFGKISVVPKKFEPGIINPRLMKITLNQKLVIPIFFKFLIVSEGIRARIENYSHGGTMGIVNIGIMKKIKIPVPPISLQQKFADLVQKVEKLKEKQSESEKELNNLFNSLMQRAFRG